MAQIMATPRRTPSGESLDSKSTKAVLEVLSRLKTLPGALLPILHGVQDALGYVPPAAVPLIADALNQTRAEVHGVISFYHYFRTEPRGRHVVYLCRAEACQAVGAAALERHARQRLGIDFHQTTTDGLCTLEPVYCLGNCACGPSLMVDEELHAAMDAEQFDGLIDDLKARVKEDA